MTFAISPKVRKFAMWEFEGRRFCSCGTTVK